MALGETLKEARKAKNLVPSEVAAKTRMKVQIVEALEAEDFDKIAAPIYGKGFIKLYAELVDLDPRPLIDEYTARLGSEPKRPSLSTSAPETEPGEAEDAESEDETEGMELFAEATPDSDDETEPEPAVPVAAEESAVEEPAPKPTRSMPRPNLKIDVSGLGRLWEQVRRGVVGMVAAAVAAVKRGGVKLRAAWQSRMQLLSTIRFSEFPLRSLLLLVGVLVLLVFILSGLGRCVGWPPQDMSVGAGSESSKLILATDPPPTYLD